MIQFSCIFFFGAREAGLGPEKKIRLINGSGPGLRSRPAGWVRVRKTRPEPDPLPFLVDLGQERYAEKPITYILLQVSISYIGIRASIGCSQCHRHIWLVLNTFYSLEICCEFLCTSHGLQWQVLTLSISCLEINICSLYYMY